jgi:hypothetical protein
MTKVDRASGQFDSSLEVGRNRLFSPTIFIRDLAASGYTEIPLKSFKRSQDPCPAAAGVSLIALGTKPKGSLLKAQGPPWSTASVNITPFCVDAGQPILKNCLEFTLLVTSFL